MLQKSCYRHKTRNGARGCKTYYPAKGLYRKLWEFDVLASGERDALVRVYRSLNPVRLKRQLDAAPGGPVERRRPTPGPNTRSVTLTLDTMRPKRVLLFG